MDTQTEIFELLEPIIQTVDTELIDVEWTGGTLRVSVDQPEGITTQKIVEVTRLISPVLDQHDPIAGRYTLEVSSPGVERALTRLSHFQRAVNEKVTIKLAAGTFDDHSRRVKGQLVSVDAEGEILVVSVDEKDGVPVSPSDVVDQQIAVDQVLKARTVYDWEAAFAADGRKKQKKQLKRSN